MSDRPMEKSNYRPYVIDSRPTLLFMQGSRGMRINAIGLSLIGSPFAIGITPPDDKGQIRISPDRSKQSSIVRKRWTANAFNNAKVQKQLLAAGYRKDRVYIGVADDNTLTFSVDRYEEKQ